MRIACYALAHNEELFIPHFIKHYKQFCSKITIYDNMSTDNTKHIALDNGCNVISWEALGGGLNDKAYIEIKSECYKKDREFFDWVITVDCDELITHKNGISDLLNYLENCKNKNIKLPTVQGYNMFSWDYDFKNPIDSIKHCIPSESYSKSVVFNPELNISWDAGCHHCNLANDSESTEIILKHYKYINFEYVINRSKYFGSRLSKTNLENGYGVHYLWSSDDWFNYFKKLDKEKMYYGS
jgi:hypothetical protein